MKIQTKYRDFISKHRYFLTQFEKSSSTLGKYKLLKTTMNIDNPQFLQSQSNKNIALNEFDSANIQSGDMYFRQLGRMCQGHEQYECDKMEEKKKKHSVKKTKSQILKGERITRSQHFQKKFQRTEENRSKIKHNGITRKFLELPCFTQVSDESSTFLKMNQGPLRKRKCRKLCDHSKMDENKDQKHRYLLKSDPRIQKQKIYDEIKILKEKAKTNFGLDFDEFDIENSMKQNMPQNKQEHKQSRNHHHYLSHFNQNKSYFQLKHKIEEKFHIPQNLLVNQTKKRPATVLSKSTAKSKSYQKMNYFVV